MIRCGFILILWRRAAMVLILLTSPSPPLSGAEWEAAAAGHAPPPPDHGDHRDHGHHGLQRPRARDHEPLSIEHELRTRETTGHRLRIVQPSPVKYDVTWRSGARARSLFIPAMQSLTPGPRAVCRRPTHPAHVWLTVTPGTLSGKCASPLSRPPFIRTLSVRSGWTGR